MGNSVKSVWISPSLHFTMLIRVWRRFGRVARGDFVSVLIRTPIKRCAITWFLPENERNWINHSLDVVLYFRVLILDQCIIMLVMKGTTLVGKMFTFFIWSEVKCFLLPLSDMGPNGTRTTIKLMWILQHLAYDGKNPKFSTEWHNYVIYYVWEMCDMH